MLQCEYLINFLNNLFQNNQDHISIFIHKRVHCHYNLKFKTIILIKWNSLNNNNHN